MQPATLYSHSIQRETRHASRVVPFSAPQGSVLTWRLGVLKNDGTLDSLTGVDSVSLGIFSYGGATPGSMRWAGATVEAAAFNVPADAESVLDESDWNAEVVLSSEEMTMPVNDDGERSYWYEWRAQLTAGGESVLATGVLILRGTSQTIGNAALDSDLEAEEAAREAADAALAEAGQGVSGRVTTIEGQIVTINTDLPLKANTADVIKERAPMQRPIVTHSGAVLTMVQGDLGAFVYDTHFADSTLTIPAGLGPTAELLAAESERFNNSPGRRSVLAAGGVTLKPSGVVIPAYTAALFTRVAADTWTVIPYGFADAVSGTPVALTIPTIEGAHIVGQVLEVTQATWEEAPDSVTIQWYRGQTPISGATGTTYVLTSDDIGFTISVQEIATNDAGSTYVGSVDSEIVDVGVWLDSVGGNDARTGVGPTQSVKTVARLMELVPDATDKNIVVVTDSVFKEMLELTGDRMHILAVGSGARPFFDCTEIIPSFTKTPGRTNVYEADLVLPGNVSIKGNIWANGIVFNSGALSIGSVDATPGTAFIDDWTAPTAKLYLHAAGSAVPITGDGKEYTYSRRDQGILATGEGVRITGVHTYGNAHQAGSIKIIGEGAVLTNVRCSGGCRHACFVQPGALIVNCVFDGQCGNFLEAPFYSNSIVCNISDIQGKSWRLTGCTFGDDTGPGLTGPLQHGSAQDALFGLVEHWDCTYRRCAGCGSLGAELSHILRPIFDRAAGGFSWASPGQAVIIEYGTGTANQILAPSIGGNVTCRHNVISIPMLGPGFLRLDSSESDLALTLLDELYTVTDGIPAVSSNQLIRWKRGAINATSVRVTPVLCSMADDMVYAGMTGGTCSYAGTGNQWPYGARFQMNNITYNTLAAWQAAGFDTGSSHGTFPATVASDDFAGAVGNLDVRSGWTLTSGTAATMGTNGAGQLGSISAAATNTHYTRQTMAGADHWVKCTLGTIPAGSGPYFGVRCIDENNGFIYRATSTNHQVYTMIGGTLVLLLNIASLTPLPGDIIVLAVKGTRMWLYVNDRMVTKGRDISASTALAAATKVGVTRRGGAAFATFIDSFECGLVPA